MTQPAGDCETPRFLLKVGELNLSAVNACFGIIDNCHVGCGLWRSAFAEVWTLEILKRERERESSEVRSRVL